MKVFESIHSLDGMEKGYALSIGNFDGVHLGHRRIIDSAKNACKKLDAPGLALMTFDPHPVAILHPEKAPGILTPLPMKKFLLEQTGIDSLIVIKDSFDLLNLSPGDFVDKFLMHHISPSVVIEGPNFNFGYGRSGDVNTLKSLAADRNFKVRIVKPQHIKTDDGREIMCSSSMIRNSLESGDVNSALEMLGRPYRLMGPVMAGRGIGTKIGFPTANIKPAKQIIPAEGVYAGYVGIGENLDRLCRDIYRYPAVFSIGRAKTFVRDYPLLVEAHIFCDDVGQLYGKWLAMDFVKKLRNQQRFENEHLLAEQITRDCRIAKGVLQEYESRINSDR